MRSGGFTGGAKLKRAGVSDEMKNMLVKVGWEKDMVGICGAEGSLAATIFEILGGAQSDPLVMPTVRPLLDQHQRCLEAPRRQSA